MRRDVTELRARVDAAVRESRRLRAVATALRMISRARRTRSVITIDDAANNGQAAVNILFLSETIAERIAFRKLR